MWRELLTRGGFKILVIETMQHPARNFDLCDQERDPIFRVKRRFSLPAAGRVFLQRLFEFVADADVIHHQAAGLVLEDTVDARNRLHQRMTAHRLVNVHRVKTLHIKTRQPHLTHDDQLEFVLRVGAVPFRFQLDDLVVKLRADVAAHTDDHRLAIKTALPVGEVPDEVGSNLLQSRARADQWCGPLIVN